jgi:hypothetical protein
MGIIKPSGRVYSYIRFSTPQQEWGRSEQRQLDEAEKWAAANSCTIDPMRMADKGYSAFRGEHRKNGTLGVFLRLVEKGEVPRGSVLLVENVDRLGREGAHRTIRHVIFPLFDFDITIQTLGDDPRTYNEDTIENEISELVGELKRAWRESKRKQEMRKDSWANTRNKLQNKERANTGQLPAWLQRVDGEIVEIPDAAKVLNQIYDLRLKPWTIGQIVRYLNENATRLKLWQPGTRGWTDDYVRKILRTPAVCGVYQAHERIGGKYGKRVPIAGAEYANHYPEVVPKSKYFAVRDLAKNDRGTGGRPNLDKNVLVKLARCAYCGGKMYYKSSVRPTLYCYTGKWKKGCKPRQIRYDECFALVFDNCRNLDPSRILPGEQERRAECRELYQAIASAKGKHDDLVARRTVLDKQLEVALTPEIGLRIQKRMKELDDEIKIAAAEVESGETSVKVFEQTERDIMLWQQGMDALKPAIKDDKNVGLRQQLNAHFRKLIKTIEVFAHGHDQMFDPDEEAKAERSILRSDKTGKLKELRRTAPDAYWRELYRHPTMKELGERERLAELFGVWFVIRTKKPLNSEFAKFQEWVTDQRMSRHGRFLRIHFTTGETIDMVPPGSCGSGEKLTTIEGKQVWQYVDPDLDEMLEKYRKVTKSRVYARKG